MGRDGQYWYVTIIASLYLVLCSSACFYYASLHFRADAGAVPIPVQLLCLGMAFSAFVYFLKPRVGHRGLLILTFVTLIAIGTSDAKATCFHLVVLAILLFPVVSNRIQREHRASNSMKADSLSVRLQSGN